jgi:ABC-type multidrug transport system ATPase subunit/predicted component of type VI protein secretion system/F0F1-type ATP synthase membrane subunit c/vacuolar-type H+-ATPase subunit K
MAGGRDFVLKASYEGGRVQYLLKFGKTIIGRAPTCEVMLVAENISRRHTQIEVADDGCSIMDLGSANGTLLEDVILPPRKKIPLEPGQVIKVSQFDLSISPYQEGDVVEMENIILRPDASVSIGATDLALDQTMMATFAAGMPASKPNFFLIFSDQSEAWQSIQLYDGEYIIGREPGCDVQIKAMGVSRQHARIKVEGDNFWVTDLNSSNGVILNGEKVEPDVPYPVEPENIFVISKMPFLVSKEGQVQTSLKGELSGFATQVVSEPVLDMYQSLSRTESSEPRMTQASMITDLQFLDLSGQDRINIGRSEDNSIHFDHPAVSRFHAMIERMGKRFRITDTQSANGVFVNGVLIEEQAWLKEGDVIKIGPYDFIFTGLGIQVDPTEGYTIEARGIHKWVTKDLNLLKNISLDIGANEFVAVVGMSGAGKTTFMDTINGYRPATDGNVFINGTSLYDNYDMFRDDIGYVPQRDIVHMELTPWMALDYAGQLRFPPDTTRKERSEAIEQTLKDLGLWERKDVVISRLSGGQLKRVSIGVELLTRPRLLFLDEPTSGLDPGTEFEMMKLMRHLADQGRTVMVVTHTTKNVMLCDKVVILGTGGYLVFYGAPEDALTYFDGHRTAREKLERTMEFDEIYRLLEDPDRGSPADWAERFKQSVYGKQAVAVEEPAEHTVGLSVAQLSAAAAPSIKQAKKISSLRQLAIMSARNMRILFQDRISLALILALAPVLGLMNSIWGRDIYNPTTGNIEKTMGLWFMSAIVAMLVGTMSSVREIVKEADIYKRERAVGLKIFPYVFSKIWLGFIMALYQGGVIIAIAMLLVKQPEAAKNAFPQMFITIVFGVVTGYLIGLVISAAVPNQNSALIALIAVVVPQLLFGGMFVPLEQIPFGEQISYAIFSRWTNESFVVSTEFGDTLASDQCWRLPPEERSALTNEDKNDPNCPCMGTHLFQDCATIPGILSEDYYDDVAKKALAQPEPAKPAEPTTLPSPTPQLTPTQLASPTPLPSSTPYPSPTPLPTPLLIYELDEYQDASLEQSEAYYDTRSEQMSEYYDLRTEQMNDYFDAVQDQYGDFSDEQQGAMEDYMDQRQEQAEDYSSALDQYGNDLADWQRNRQKAVSAAENVLKNINTKFGSAFRGTVQDRWMILGIQSAVMFVGLLVLMKRKDIL